PYAETLKIWAELSRERDPELARELITQAARLSSNAHTPRGAAYWYVSHKRSRVVTQVLAKRHERFIFVIPVYNAERYIGKCLDSVLRQRNPVWGAIVVDDASTDGTLAVVRKTVGDDARFTVIANQERRYALFNIDQALTGYCGDGQSVIGV